MSDWDAGERTLTWAELFGSGARTWDQFGAYEEAEAYGCPDNATYGTLFGNTTQTYGDFCSPVTAVIINEHPATVPGSGVDQAHVTRWYTGTVPLTFPQIFSVGAYALELPFQSHPAPKPMFSPLPAVCDCWNDEQDLADILHALGMG